MDGVTMRDFLVAVNPHTSSSLPFLLLVPYGGGVVLAAAATWPRERSVFCQKRPVWCWPRSPEIVDRSATISCERRGASIELVLDRRTRNRSRLVYTTARGQEMIFWQTARARGHYPERMAMPASAAAGATGLEIIIDTREKDGYDFAHQPVRLVRSRLASGDYGLALDGKLLATVERKSLPDLAASLADHRLDYALAELADRIAALQVRYPSVPIIFPGSRALAQEWIYRFLAAARQWAVNEAAAAVRLGDGDPVGPRPLRRLQAAYSPTELRVRTWARTVGLPQAEHGPIPPGIWAAWHRAHPQA